MDEDSLSKWRNGEKLIYSLIKFYKINVIYRVFFYFIFIILC
jgi:hypothetical protein